MFEVCARVLCFILAYALEIAELTIKRLRQECDHLEVSLCSGQVVKIQLLAS